MERSADLESWLRDGYAAMERGDVDAIDGVVSRADGTVMIGTDPNEWWHGHEVAFPWATGGLSAVSTSA
jgi:ketosteroid isomerase-like protein